MLHHLTTRFVEDDHSELLVSDLLEHEKVTNMQVMSNGESWPPPIKACFTIEIREGDSPDATYIRPKGDLCRHLSQVWPEGLRNWRGS